MSDNDNLPADAGGTGTATPSDSSLDNPANWNFADPDDDQDTPETQTAESESDDEPAEAAESDQEAEESDGEQPEAKEGDEPTEKAPGDDVKVSLPGGEEVTLAELRNGYLRQSDYTRKTTQVAEQRRSLEDQSERLTRTATALAAFIEKQIPPPPDPQLMFSDHAAHYQQMQMHNAAMAQVRELLEMANAPKEVSKAINQESERERLTAENAKLAERFPETTKPDTRAKFFEVATGAARELGFSESELANVTDHRLFALAHYAKIGMEAQKAKATAAKKVASAPPVSPPKKAALSGDAQVARKNIEAMRRLSRTGSIADAMAVDFD